MDNRQKLYAGIGAGIAAFAAIAYMALRQPKDGNTIPVRPNLPSPRTPKLYEDINVAEFLSVCVYLSEESGKIIRQVEESGQHQTKSKGIENPVTVADLRVQKTLEVCLKALYPTLRVQGEESKESMANI